MEDRGDRYGGLPRPRDARLKRLRERIEAMLDRFRGTDPETGETDYWNRGGLAGLLGMPAWYEQSPVDIAMGFAGSTTPAVKALSAPTKGIRGYHGSPHDFPAERLIRRPGGSTEYIVGQPDKLPDLPAGVELVRDFPLGRFRDDKIGTGEGAQAFGYGHYSAGNEGVARSYRDALSRPELLWQGSRLEVPDWKGLVKSGEYKRMSHEARVDLSARDMLARMDHPRNGRTLDDEIASQMVDARIIANKSKGAEADYWRDVAKRIEQLGKDLRVNEGKMYEVQINADPERFLDWDLPLSGQSEYVQDAFGRAIGQPALTRYRDLSSRLDEIASRPAAAHDANPQWQQEWDKIAGERRSLGVNPRIMNQLGGNIYKSDLLVPGSYRDPIAASDALRDAGIPGIKYLDQGSRKAGEGSRNYVVFNPDIIDILRKYGLLPPIVGGAASGLPAPHEASR